MVFLVPVGMPSAIPARVIVLIVFPIHVVMVAYTYLFPVMAFISAISFPINLAMAIGLGFIDDYFIPSVDII